VIIQSLPHLVCRQEPARAEELKSPDHLVCDQGLAWAPYFGCSKSPESPVLAKIDGSMSDRRCVLAAQWMYCPTSVFGARAGEA